MDSVGGSSLLLRTPWSDTAWSFPAGGFVLLWCGTALVALVVFLTHPRRLTPPREAAWILCLALACRVALFAHDPSDDVYRYLWEGRMAAEGVNPYHVAPADPTLAPWARGDPYHARINHPDLTAAYPPLMILTFSWMVRLAYEPWLIKAALVVSDLGALALLLALLARRALPLRWSYFYALHPAVLYAFAGQSHLDAFSVLFLTAALVAYDRRRWALMWLLAGLAVQSKYVAVLTLPLLLRRENARSLPWLAVAVLLPALPWLPPDPSRLFGSLVQFGRDFSFNGPLHQLLQLCGVPRLAATRVCALALAGALGWAYVRWHPLRHARFTSDPAPGCHVVLLALLLCSPTVHVWYLTWVAPFAALCPTGSWLVLAATSGFYYVVVGVMHQTGAWRLPLWAWAAQWIPFGLLLACEGRRAWMRRSVPAEPSPQTLSVVIPTRRDAAALRTCLAALADSEEVSEVIVVDADANDETKSVTAAAGARLLVHAAPPEAGGGRGGQVRAGVEAAGGDVVAVLHADTRVGAHDLRRARQALQQNPSIVGGSCGGCFEGEGLSLRLLDVANDFRASILGLPFGDQVQFFRRRALARSGGFPALPLMEDVELGLRLGRLGRTVHLFGGASLSPRRWQRRRLGRTVQVLWLVFLYLVTRRRTARDPAGLYHRYYGRGDG